MLTNLHGRKKVRQPFSFTFRVRQQDSPLPTLTSPEI
jgi:hypothetical protein